MADVKHTQWPQLGEMTVEQMNAWGAAEHAARMQDLTDRTPEGLARAQANAEARRKAIGASRSAAATMVSDASRARRRAEMSGAARATECSATDAAECTCAAKDMPFGRCCKAGAA